MRILYIYREKEKQEHSIEAVFDTVAENIEKFGHTVRKWYKPVSLKQTVKDIWRLRKEKFDIYHITGDVNYLWIFFPFRKTTMTCHDIGMYKNNAKTLKRRLFVFVSFYLASIFLKKITAVSELTKNDLVNILHIKEEKVTVIPNPLSLHIKRCPKKFNSACPTILQIGTGWHKNLEGLIESIKGLKCHVEIVGQPCDNDMKRMTDYGIDYSISHHISEAELIQKYEECDILYFVSRSEGFGLPIIEAQTIGRIVLTANSEPMRSVANGAALLFDSENHKGIKDGILQIIRDSVLRENLIKNGFENAKLYNPENISKQYESFYESYKIYNK